MSAGRLAPQETDEDPVEDCVLERLPPLPTLQQFPAFAAMLADELKRINRIYALFIERIIASDEVPLPVLAEALEDIANTYLDFSELLIDRHRATRSRAE